MLTYEEFLEKYGNEKVKFKSYYKYNFTFSNEKGLIICFGGNSDDIYKIYIADNDCFVSDFDCTSAYLNNVLIYETVY